VLDRKLVRAGIYPPVKALPSLSRRMKDGTGGDYTYPDPPALASQLYAAYAKAVQARVLASVVGERSSPKENGRRKPVAKPSCADQPGIRPRAVPLFPAPRYRGAAEPVKGHPIARYARAMAANPTGLWGSTSNSRFQGWMTLPEPSQGTCPRH
jgi:hypothetical protein